MAEIRDLAKVGNKWRTVTSGAGDQYAEGVKDPKKDWEKNTAQAEGSYKVGVQEAITRGAFGKGVRKAGTEKWQAGAVNKGTARFGQGVAASGSAYEEGFGPYHTVIKNTSLPPRGPKGSDANYARVAAMGKALHAKKIAG